MDFNKFNLVQPYLADLRRDSESRIATNRDFNFIRQDIAQFKKLQADKTATLNEQEAIRQRQAENARRLARATEEAVRPLPDKTIYSSPWRIPARTGCRAGTALRDQSKCRGDRDQCQWKRLHHDHQQQFCRWRSSEPV